MHDDKLKKLAIEGGVSVLADGYGKFEWPIIDETSVNAVVKQLGESISIYNRSGVFERFEDTFSRYHGRSKGLVLNSGTSALFSAFEGLGLGPGDEVICPAYTFFATVSPVVYTGATLVFCDADERGNIDANKIPELITDNTRAIVVTHMWGMPCDMPAIIKIAQHHHIPVIEDCSHAHGAEIGGRKVGSFGEIAAWSLQGQKIVTGGEGGILLTDNNNIYNRALLQGHYNKRCRSEIPQNYELSEFSTSGMGLKLRAHPLAIALAEEQFTHLDAWLKTKRKFAAEISEVLAGIPFLKLPVFDDRQPSWYAYVMNYDANATNGVSLNQFVTALHAEGLSEVDVPTSTGVIADMPLFRKTEKIMPRLYSKPAAEIRSEYKGAQKFFSSAFKIPVWAREQDREIMLSYALGIKKVAEAVVSRPEIFLGIK
ncbi:DegT/DnrJ/EryC1/StrS family aminotransferase [Pectobacteriaceae bacterium C52]|nr:DegT/DnrJ/EryC1/StrS family aminotransferase [Pectobacteriaceae bacterium C52]